jgi:hypothetical protein
VKETLDVPQWEDATLKIKRCHSLQKCPCHKEQGNEQCGNVPDEKTSEKITKHNTRSRLDSVLLGK